MRRLIAAFGLLAGFCVGAVAQPTGTNTVGSSSLVSGTTPLTCSSGTTGILYQKSGAVQCDSTFTYDGTSTLTWPSTAQVNSTGNISFRAGSTGVFGVINFVTGSGVGWQMQNAGPNLIVTTDNCCDIGASGANRPKSLWLAGNASVAGTIINAGITTDSGQTATATVCEDTTTHQYYFGSGTGGICKGTSSAQFKQDIRPAPELGLANIVSLEPKRYRYRDGIGQDTSHEQVGLIAEDVIAALPECASKTSVDYLCVAVVSVNAIKALKAQIEELRHGVN